MLSSVRVSWLVARVSGTLLFTCDSFEERTGSNRPDATWSAPRAESTRVASMATLGSWASVSRTASIRVSPEGVACARTAVSPDSASPPDSASSANVTDFRLRCTLKVL